MQELNTYGVDFTGQVVVWLGAEMVQYLMETLDHEYNQKSSQHPSNKAPATSKNDSHTNGCLPLAQLSAPVLPRRALAQHITSSKRVNIAYII
jgi:hypothetical protein